MKHHVLTFAMALSLAATVAPADEPQPAPPAPEAPQAPRTHVDTTVVGSASPEDASPAPDAPALQNDHHFEAGAPDLVKITNQLHLTKQQQAQLDQVIERADAGAAVLIKREHDVRDMIAATTTEDPMYAKLVADQAAGESRWAENREGLRHDALVLLTPAQRARFEQLETQH